MKRIDAIVIHCSATREGMNIKAADIDRWHREQGFSEIGYHFVIDLDGTVETGRALPKDGAHCNLPSPSGESYNKHSVGICYIGGLDKNGRAKDTRTLAQKKSLDRLVRKLMDRYPITDVLGHRDASPDKDGDGQVTKDEWVKDCPCFDVRAEFAISVCVAKKNKTKIKCK